MESDFAREFLKCLWDAGWHCTLIPDDGKTNLEFGSKFRARKKPYDAVAGHPQYGTAAFEFKQIRKGLRFPFKAVEPHQYEGLEEASRVGWHALVVVHFLVRTTQSERKRLSTDSLLVDEVLVFRVKSLQELMRQGHLSIGLDDPPDGCIRLERFPFWEIDALHGWLDTTPGGGGR